MKHLIIGCGLTGAVIARELAQSGAQVEIWDRRDHIGGNMYDYIDEHGFLVQKYGPHIFFTSKKELYDYMLQFEQWQKYVVKSGAVWGGRYVPMPFNFATIDMFYPPEQAALLKEKLERAFGGRKTVTITEILTHSDADIREYAEFLFKNDVAPYTAKQWGVPPDEIDPSVLKRVPLRLSYDEDYLEHRYQILPEHSFTAFFERLLDHPGISVRLGVEALDRLSVRDDRLFLDGTRYDGPVIYTGALDELFGRVYGDLPYRSVRFEWRYTEEDSIQPEAVVAYPQAEGYTRITEYKKLPIQNGTGSSYALEYPLPYKAGERMEPYYPVLTAESQERYKKYRELADRVPNLICCGRLADFKYYNMDHALERALNVCGELLN